MNYDINIYKATEDNSSRFIFGNVGSKNLIVVGLNPSTADGITPDRTIKKVMGFAQKNNFDGFIMLNLYPQRETKPVNLPYFIDENIFEENINYIESLVAEFENSVVLAAWSENVIHRFFLIESIKRINDVFVKKNIKWIKLGELTRSGHPRHPLYVSYDTDLTNFNVEEYIENLLKKHNRN